MRFRLGSYDEAVEREIAELTAERAAARIFARDATFWGGDARRQQSVSNRLGWTDAPSRFKKLVPELRGFAAEVREAGFTSTVVLGMGGSSLAPEVLRRSIPAGRGAPALHVLDSTDPSTISAVERAIDVPRSLFFVSSKSGGTIEVASLFAYFHERVSESKRERAGENFVAITDEGTALETMAQQYHFRKAFLNPPDIGGRYSALSYFGLAPAAAAGADVERLLEYGVRVECAERSEAGAGLRLGAALGALAREGRNKLTLVVAPEISAQALWLEQLIAESTGKEGTGIVPVADEPLGSPRKYGADRLFVQIRLEGGSAGEQDSVVAALVAEGHPAIVIDLDSPYELGAEFYRWEFATSIAGRVLGINPFDEPNVQESKDNTARILSEGGVQRSSPVEAHAGVDVVSSLLPELRPGGYFAITAYIEETDATNAAFADIRARVRDATGAAATLGYGPRYLHSTGQLHKGGPEGGVFLQVTADDLTDIAIPGRAYTFGGLKQAQARGDYESLITHERPVQRVHLGADLERGLGSLRASVVEASGGAATR